MKQIIENPKHFFNQETNIFIPGDVGNLEAVVSPPVAITDSEAHTLSVGVFCHPNPTQGGTMNNKVVTTIIKAFNRRGLYGVRFNFRGVGLSEGHFGNTIGELEDLKKVIEWVKGVASNENKPLKLWLGGFSFGSYIAAKYVAEMGANSEIPIQQLFSIAPPVDRLGFSDFHVINCPWLVIQGTEDEVVSAEQVFHWHALMEQKSHHPPALIKLEETGHFFHGKLIVLRDLIEQNLVR